MASQHTYRQLHSSRLSNARATTTQHKHSTELSWRFVPDATLPGHRKAHWWVPAWTPTVLQCPHGGKAVGGSTAHTSTWHRSAQQTRTSQKQIHEVTTTDSVIRARGSGACCGHTAQQVWSMDSRTDRVSEEQGHRERRAVNRDGVSHQVERRVRCRDRARRHSPPRALCTTMDERKLDGM